MADPTCRPCPCPVCSGPARYLRQATSMCTPVLHRLERLDKASPRWRVTHHAECPMSHGMQVLLHPHNSLEPLLQAQFPGTYLTYDSLICSHSRWFQLIGGDRRDWQKRVVSTPVPTRHDSRPEAHVLWSCLMVSPLCPHQTSFPHKG